jgi:shikimate kinase
LKALAEQREPAYAEAHITVDSAEAPHSATVNAIIQALEARAS